MKNCPFCGGEARITTGHDPEEVNGLLVTVNIGCPECWFNRRFTKKYRREELGKAKPKEDEYFIDYWDEDIIKEKTKPVIEKAENWWNTRVN